MINRCDIRYVRLGTAAIAAALLAGCAAPPRSLDASGAARRTATELLALQPGAIRYAMASNEGERTVYATEVATMRASFALPPGDEADERLPAALDTALHFNVDLDVARERLIAALARAAGKPPRWQRSVLTAAHALLGPEAAPRIEPLLPELRTPREFAIAAYTLLRVADNALTRQTIRSVMQRNFADAAQEPRLRALDARLRDEPSAPRPPLADLFATPPRAGFPTLYSLQRKDRAHAGLALVRGADGRFVRHPDGSLFAVAQYALARSNLPGTITNGNTPQGVFVVKGTGSATNRWIGPTPYIESMLPIEAPFALFDDPAQRDALPALDDAARRASWSEAAYLSLLPASWREWWPLREAWLAGLAGRDEILAHGNAINTDYYRGERFYPTAPSAGCLVAAERWSGGDGTLVQSDQLALVQAFVAGGRDVGYLVVVELDDAARAVTLADVADAIAAAEARR
ncbi:MAG: hypothetical protein LC098_09490 [Burkholderiales bacterium]|nr:hypothetical protein [Burkholderiales bacterium]